MGEETATQRVSHSGNLTWKEGSTVNEMGKGVLIIIKKPRVPNSFKTSQILSMNFLLIVRIQRGAISILDREGADL